MKRFIPPSISTNGRDASTSSTVSQSQNDLRSFPTTHLRLDQLASLSAPVFSDVNSRFPILEWAGVFGSFCRGTQRPDSDIDVLVGHSSDADFLADVCGALYELLEALPSALGSEVDIVNVVQGYPLGYVQMEGLLTSKTLWGDPSWPNDSQAEAEELLNDGYRRWKDASEIARKVYEMLPSPEVFLSPQSQQLRESVLKDLLRIMDLVRFDSTHPFQSITNQLLHWLFSLDSAVRICLQIEGKEESLREVWAGLSDKTNKVTISKTLLQMAEQTFHRAGLAIP